MKDSVVAGRWDDKHPDDQNIDYAFDWAVWLQEGESITSYQWFAQSGLTVVGDALVDTVTIVTLSGGTDGYDYSVRGQITTDADPARVMNFSWTLSVRN